MSDNAFHTGAERLTTARIFAGGRVRSRRFKVRAILLVIGLAAGGSHSGALRRRSIVCSLAGRRTRNWFRHGAFLIGDRTLTKVRNLNNNILAK